MTDAKKTTTASPIKTAVAKTQSAADQQTKQDAEALLKADHRKVEELFQQYEDAEEEQKKELAQQICRELIVHTKLEEEIFYPACREKDVEDDMLDEAQVEHDGAKVLIAELLNGSPGEEFYDAKVCVLSEYIKHHVGEEEKPSDGIFAKAKEAGVDMNAIGTRIQARKQELMSQIDTLGSRPPQPRSLDLTHMTQEKYMPRYSNDRDRDEYGRFTSDDDYGRGRSSSSRGGYSSRSSRYDEDDNRNNGRRSSGSLDRDRDRDEYGRFASDDDYGRSRSSGGGYPSRSSRYDEDYDDRNSGRRSSSSQDRDRDEYGRFMSDDDYDRNGRHSRSQERDRDEYGRFMSDGDDYRSSRYSRSSSSRSSGGRGQGGWFGDSEGHSEAAERGWEHRGASRGGPSRGSSRYDDDEDNRSGRSSRSSSGGSRSGGRGHGGWFGDSRGHSEAARRGWEDR